MIRQLLPIAIATALLTGCHDRPVPPAERRPEKPQKTTQTEPVASVEKQPDLSPVVAEQRSMYDLPLVIEFDDLPEIPARLLDPSPPIVEEE